MATLLSPAAWTVVPAARGSRSTGQPAVLVAIDSMRSDLVSLRDEVTMSGRDSGSGLYRLVGILSSKLIAQSAAQAALPSLYAATAPDIDSGQFYGPDRLGELRRHPTLVAPDPAAQDPALAGRLWTVSEELTGVAYPFTVAP